MSNTTNIKNWKGTRLTEHINDDNDVSVAKFMDWRQCAKEKKVAKEQRRLEAKAKAKRKVEEEVRHKRVEQEWLRIAQEAYIKKMQEEAWKCKEAEEEVKKQVRGNHLGADVY